MGSSEWKEIRLGELMVAKYGKSLPARKRINGEYPVYGSGGISGTHNKPLVNGPGIIIGRKGTVGSIYYEDNSFFPIDTTYYVEQSSNYNLKFLFYKLHTVGLSSMNTHSAVPGLSRENLYKAVIQMPSVPEQKAIANILSTLDERIEVNNQINKTLEEMAQAIFKHWFVDFEFPNDKGEPYKSSGGEMVESELGMIPKGWKVVTLEEVTERIDNRGKTPPLSKEKTEYPIIDVKALSGEERIINFNNCSKFVDKDTYNNWFRSGHPVQDDILISTVGSIAEMKMFQGNIGCIAQNVVALRSNRILPFYLYQYIKHIKNELISYDIGSVQPSIKITHIIKYKIIKPILEIENRFSELARRITNFAYNNTKENEALSQIRNTLLPKLMSGEIRVPIKSGGEVS